MTYRVRRSSEVEVAEADDGIRLFMRDAEGYERVVFAELIIPDVLNTYGDLHTRESVKEFAYGFMLTGFGIDVEHDEIDRPSLSVVESFIAREGDPDFIEGSWVMGVHVGDDDLWGQVCSGTLNGFSYQGWVSGLWVEVAVSDQVTRYGTTQPDMYDGHTHGFFVLLTAEGSVIGGGTTSSEGHIHVISNHTFTQETENHIHIFNHVTGIGGL